MTSLTIIYFLLSILRFFRVVLFDTPFLIGSLSKTLKSLAIMMLVEEGKIELDEPIQSYIPSFTYRTDSSKQITVLHLLEQTSGISSFEGLKVTDKDRSKEGAINQAVKELSGVALSHEPGEIYEYNNYLLLGAIVEKVSNQTFSDFLNTTIFTPLGMENKLKLTVNREKSQVGSPTKRKFLWFCLHGV
nr:serine hydrolase domain-containing protein [Salibacterium halotolerans]